jgi:hypothetical protein
MADFFTPVEISSSPVKTSYLKKHVFIGSCFTENIGTKMQDRKFFTDINPFGILFNPSSIALSIRRLISGEAFSEHELFFHGGLWHSYLHHGRFSNPSLQATLSGLNERLVSSAGFLRAADFLIITFGTAWIFELKSSGMTVSNCHKVPASYFKRYKMSVSDIVTEMRNTLEQLWEVNPGIKVIFTVSPVRHLKDGANGNQLSKATLLLATDALVNGFGPERCSYFPAFELMMDELRDYRFYAEDMVHPNPVAIDFIWKKFRECFMEKETKDLSEEIASLIQARDHRPIFRNSPEYKMFIDNTLGKIRKLTKKYPFLDFSAEIKYFSGELDL